MVWFWEISKGLFELQFEGIHLEPIHLLYSRFISIFIQLMIEQWCRERDFQNQGIEKPLAQLKDFC